ncbi:agmatine deiminase family protein [Lewinella sp. JB7]|uniref:agmatine deiminase family protein n=1 Tax=Lewinella sp. JB7 TaxID=2962887 RepID=UPI0020C9FA33|nr:agmatine deiminase family protein [Lewinella sp. JB7]MCP9235051.1 agmatine deiminase family protein [Lewinella sp. JB7]
MRRLPAEWESQQMVFCCFPRREGDWGAVLEEASAAMIEAANRIHVVCPVTLIVSDREHFAAYAADFHGSVLELPADDSWIRDSGPITVFDTGPVLLDFTFNGWGGKFDAHRDNALPAGIHRHLFPTAAYQRIEEVLEGGSIESDGRGTILTTTRCLLSDGRNDYPDRTAAERLLITTLGARRVIWLDHGELIGDDTDAHIDTVARFLDAETVAYVGPPPAGDPQYDDFVAMREEIRQKLADYRLVELPWTGTITSRIDGHQLPASYANFLISNGSLFLPVYGVPADAEAIAVLEAAADYRIVPVNCRPFVEQHGALHCLTMQIPEFP